MTERATPSIPFVGLHSHAAGSIFDAMGYWDQHADFAWENGMDALACTEHGNMFSLPYQVIHTKKMQAEGKNFKPIFGIEAYFIDDLDKWKVEKEDWEKTQKVKKTEEQSGPVVEDEEESKQAGRNILNRRAHLVLLAQNQVGLNNIFSLVSKSYDGDSFYRFPRVDYKMLREHNEGIIVSSACLGGPLSKCFWENRSAGPEAVHSAMVDTINNFKSIFGDRFYCELQWNRIREQHEVNQHIIRAADQTNTELVSTADAHYPRPEMFKDRELYKQLGWLGKAKPDYAESKLPESRSELKCELYPKNGDQMWETYKNSSAELGYSYDDNLVKKSLTNTYHIAHNRIETFFPDTEVRLPDFVVPKGSTATEELTKLCIGGLKQLGLDTNPEYVQRLKDEIHIIDDRGFSKYFLTMKAVSDEASKVQLVGAGRGSAAGSLVAYVLGITGIDPIRYSLLFSRFLRSDAKDYPDIDYDVADPMSLKELLIEKWGKNTVVPISNYNTLQLRSLIKDIAKFYGIDFTEVNKVTSAMILEATGPAKKRHGITAGVYAPTFEEVMEFSDSLKSFLKKYPHVETHVNNLTGQLRSISRHAGGVVIADNLDRHMPLINSGGVLQTPWSEGQNVRHLEPLGFIKFDILGLASLRMLEGAISHILRRHHGVAKPTFDDVKKWYDENLHPEKMNLDDQQVYENVFHTGKWAGVFQFTEKGAQTFCQRAKPRSIIDISAITSIYRPGPLSANVHEQYVEAKENPEEIKYLHPLVEEVTKETYGFLIFQEQIALLAHKLGKNLSLDEGNALRKLLTKKGTGKGHEAKDAIHQKFIEGCVDKGISKKEAQRLWQTFEYFSGYGFNKSHAVSYSILSYQCAYLLTYFGSEWCAAFLDKEPEERKERAINIVQSLGYRVENPDINESGSVWEITKDGQGFIQPLTSIKGLGEKAVEQILEHRPFNTIDELLFHEEVSYSKLNKKAFDVLCRSQALNSLMDDRFVGLKHFWSAVAVDRPKNPKKFEENIKLYEPEGDFSKEEKIAYLVELAGIFPFQLVLSKQTIDKLNHFCIPPLGEFDPELGAAWFIPREVTRKKTAKGKDFYIVKAIDDTSKMNVIKVWGVDPEVDIVHVNRPYMAKLDYSEQWGFSIRSLKHGWKMIG